MHTGKQSMNGKEPPAPDDRLRELPEPKCEGSALSGAGLAGFILLKLNSYQKPPLAEELSEPIGTGSTGGCSCNSVCTCVPVQACACDSVCTCDTVSQSGNCSCVGTCNYSCYGCIHFWY